MINEMKANSFCKDDIRLIENYDKAIADTTQTWHCHHRDEVKVLPSGIKVIRLATELIENGRYYHCPANELIFLTPSEHHSIHSRDNNWSTKSDDVKMKISEGVKKNPNRYWKGKTFSAEHLAKLSAARRKRITTEETKAKMSASRSSEFMKSYREHYGIGVVANRAQYQREIRFYRKHGKCSWEVENG